MGIEKLLRPQSSATNPFERKLITRRKFMTLTKDTATLLVAGIALKESGNIYQALLSPFEQIDTMRDADTSVENFIKENEKLLRKTKVGCSFSPEHFNYVDDIEGISTVVDQKKALSALGIIVGELGIKDVRLGIRWSRVVDQSDKDKGFDPKLFDSEYKPYIDYCIQNNVNICLNVGPIKTFRWPEEYVPQSVLVHGKPEKGSLIAYKSVMAQRGITYLDSLLSHITQIYSPYELQRFKIIQPDNEPFHSAGENGWTMSGEYLAQTIETIDKYFPHASILLNSAGEKDLAQIYAFYSELAKNPKMIGRLIAGIDFYFKKPDTPTLPLFGKVDPITWNALLGKTTFGEYIGKFRNMGVAVEDTEIQAEPWGSETSPGNSSQDFFYAIKRCLDHLIDQRAQKSILRVWGVEELVLSKMSGSATGEHKKILQAISEINSLS